MAAELVEQYLKEALPLLIGVTPQEVDFLLQEGGAKAKIKGFANDLVPVLFVTKVAVDEEAGEEEMDSSSDPDLQISLEVTYTSKKRSGVVLLKKKPETTLDPGHNLTSQIQIANFSEESPFDSVHLFLHNSFAPYLRSFISKEHGDQKLQGGLALLDQKITELELSLYNCKQDVQVENVRLMIHPEIKAAAVRCREKGVPLSPQALGPLVDEVPFLNKLQAGVNKWVKQIETATKHERIKKFPEQSTTSQEINFWNELEKVTHSIQEAKDSEEIQCTLNILEQAKRYFATVAFKTDSFGLKAAIREVENAKYTMRNFPVDQLLTAKDLPSIIAAVSGILVHLRKKYTAKYPVSRLLCLIKAIANDVSGKVVGILSSKRLMNLPFDEFEGIVKDCESLFTNWERERESLLRRHTQVNSCSGLFKTLQRRLQDVHSFRKHHEQLYGVILRVLQETGDDQDEKSEEEVSLEINPVQEINDAYETMRLIDVLDLSNPGLEAWEAALREYETRIDRVESQITLKLRDKLGAAKNATEMFRVCSKFNALFYRPRIRAAVQEYQSELISRVKEDVEKLHEKYKMRYAKSQASRLSKLRDIPPVSGSIIWLRQLERQLDKYLQRVTDILGESAQDEAGRRLMEEGERFRERLNATAQYEQWVADVSSRGFDIGNQPLLTISRRGKNMRLDVSFDSGMSTLFKETRNLKWLGFDISLDLTLLARKVKDIYPYAVSLTEILRTYSEVESRVVDGVRPLISAFKRDVQHHISKGFQIEWKQPVRTKLEPFMKNITDAVTSYKDNVTQVMALHGDLEAKIAEVERCPLLNPKYDPAASAAGGTSEAAQKHLPIVLGEIQAIIDKFNLGKFSNLESWVAKLDRDIEGKLEQRVSNMIAAWIEVFGNKKSEDGEKEEAPPDTPGVSQRRRRNKSLMSRAKGADETQIEHGLSMTPIGLEIVMIDQRLQLHPPLLEARSVWISQLRDWLGLVCDLPRLQASRYDHSLEEEENEQPRYRTVLAKTIQQGLLEKAYEAIEEKINEVKAYVQEWLQYQTLWDMEATIVFKQLGEESIDPWRQLLEEIKAARQTFDTYHTDRSFGPLIVSFGQVQSKVSHKYDFWHQDIVHKFGGMMNERHVDLHKAIGTARTELEPQTADTSSTADAVRFIIQVKHFQRLSEPWGARVVTAKEVQDLLRKHRYSFPPSWLEYGMLAGEWAAFQDMLNRKVDSIQSQMPVLRMKITQQSDTVAGRLESFIQEWREGKPLAGDIPPKEAQSSIAGFQGKFSTLQLDLKNLSEAQEAMDIPFESDERMDPIGKEMEALKSVWAELGVVWDAIYRMGDLAWNALFPRKIRGELDQLLVDMKNMPNRIRQYDAFNYVQNQVKTYLKYNGLVTDLKSDALRDRHWRQLRSQLKADWHFSELTLGKIWASDLQRHEEIFKNIINTAQGELALEEFLKSVREFWQGYELDLVAYQKSKTRLIRGWDEMFAKLSDHMSSVSAMRMSPYFKVFEEEASHWEEKLTQIFNLFDVWLEVQRKWVYLEGIFIGSSDIENLLPRESQRFRGINKDFIGLMRKVSASPLILDVLHIENIQKTLEHIKDMLEKIQKALGEYLETQRQAFPRFYFVGDGDLLEIIGNSKEVTRIMKHLRKMFAGLAMLVLESENRVVAGMTSREGETVMFYDKINLDEYPHINDWLTQVETEMKLTLARMSEKAITERRGIAKGDFDSYKNWLETFPGQLVLVSCQVCFTDRVEACLNQEKGEVKKALQEELEYVQSTLGWLADQILSTEIDPVVRRKLENEITEMVHQRDVVRKLIAKNISSPQDFEWLYEMRFYWKKEKSSKRNKIAGQIPKNELLQNLTAEMANGVFYYGFEYLGVPDRLVQTPLTDRCYLSLTQALDARLGGSPFGPAGTGKTETVKALGGQLGRFVLVFCCDENFDFQAMGRIFVGLCQCGAWGCFDEFNRLEERILSAVSQQIQMIQSSLKEGVTQLELIGRNVTLNADCGVFITMNPGYAGRSNLPDNLKQLFRGVAMIVPDRELIAQVMLYAQGFKSAEIFAGKVVPFFRLCKEQLSSQPHYDFGLRALKSVLVRAGFMKRHVIKAQGISDDPAVVHSQEQAVLIRAVNESVTPKLVAPDLPLLLALLTDVFPNCDIERIEDEDLKKNFFMLCKQRYLVPSKEWVEKVFQFYQIQTLAHGVMVVGPSGSGKSCAWKTLLDALALTSRIPTESYVIDPKSISKDELYGVLDHTTREWTDGLFTSILRAIIDNLRGESGKIHWIVFDGDVDPEWVENLNSLLDDNKILTLPTGERLAMPDNVRIIFEVKDLKYATPATVSRCGMVWFSESSNSLAMIFENYLLNLENVPLDEQEKEVYDRKLSAAKEAGRERLEPHELEGMIGLRMQGEVVSILKKFLEGSQCIAALAYQHASSLTQHIMEWTRLQSLNSFFALLNKGVKNVIEHNSLHGDFQMRGSTLEKFFSNRLVYSLLWGFGGSLPLRGRESFGDYLQSIYPGETPDCGGNKPSLLDYKVDLETGEWRLWRDDVPVLDVEPHQVGSPDLVIPTVDTTRHVEVLSSWLADRRPVLLCGPPGSGKSMTLTSVLRNLPDVEMVTLNFSSASQPDLIHKTFDQYCQIKRTSKGMVLEPVLSGKWLIIFCDEINLPSEDSYGTQKVISFIRQLTEQNGYWKDDHHWVHLERIQFVGACNPPQDAGRVTLTERFLRWFPLLFVDFPARTSLQQIYGTYYRALMMHFPHFPRSLADSYTDAMVDFYLESQKRFTPDIHPHYIYSPRELSRWLRALWKAVSASGDQVEWTQSKLMRLFCYEALRLFQDRLVELEEIEWTDRKLDEIVLKYFPNTEPEVFKRPVLFSDWLTKEYASVDREDLRFHVKAKLKVFYEEELEVKLVLFNEVLDHILRINRVLNQPQGHMLLIGVSGGGKTVLSRFVSWMNGMSVFTIKVNNRYTAADFDHDLRGVLRRAGCDGEKICFIFDESNVLESGFLERMNTLLASGEVPGLFEGEELSQLMHHLKDATSRRNLIMDSEDEMFKWFTNEVRSNLHVVFTMNPSSPDFHNRTATSPALFNRCVLDWFGDWSVQAFYQVGQEFTQNLDLDVQEYRTPEYFPFVEHLVMENDPPTHRDAVISSLVYIHQTIHTLNERVARQGLYNYVTPRHFLDFITKFSELVNEKREELEEQKLHLNIGLQKLRDTEEQVSTMQESLAEKGKMLNEKNEQANTKLKQMLEKQQIAEVRKREALKLQEEATRQNADIAVRKASAEEKLADAEPAVERAKQSVQGIKKDHLNELRSLGRPPPKVQTTMEALCILLGHGKVDWKVIRRIIMQPDFITSIIKFDSNKITPQARKLLQPYLADNDWNYDNVNRASKACGPLVLWCRAQLRYAEILHNIEPLRNQVQKLEEKAKVVNDELAELEVTVKALEDEIQQYKDDYAILIRDTEAIKMEMKDVETKVSRSVSLLKNLSSEKGRWENESQGFQQDISTVIGDCLLSAAFLAYIGFFDQHHRRDLLRTWRSHLVDAGVEVCEDLSLANYLCSPGEQLEWQANDLPADDLCTENAIMLRRFNRYPLVIDPAGQATNFLMKQHKNKKITRTSFLDTAFMKHLETALRFGLALLVDDVESIDPVLNPVLNKEIRKAGGRILIRLGDQDVDFSPSFMIFLATRDPAVHFTPDLCSRVTFVNFTVTPSGLTEQCLHEILKVETPDMYKKRRILITTQGECKVKLKKLEENLLEVLNATKGNILENDTVISTMEALKQETEEIQSKFRDTELVFEEIEQVSQVYRGLSSCCSRVYFVLESLSQIHFLYGFSLDFFQDVFYGILHSKHDGSAERDSRIEALLRDLFFGIYHSVCRGLSHEDQMVFALRLAQLRLNLRGDSNPISDDELDFLLKGGERISKGGEKPLAEGLDALSPTQKKMLTELLSTVPVCLGLDKHIAENWELWENFLNSHAAEQHVPVDWLSSYLSRRQMRVDPSALLTSPEISFHVLLLCKALRPDRLPAGIVLCVNTVFGEGLLRVPELDLLGVVQKQKATSPILLCSSPGYDASFRVDELAVETRRSRETYRSVALGSAEGFELADKAVTEATRNGSWVLLKNCHLATQWLVTLEKKLHSMKLHENFRLFLTAEVHPNLPSNLIRQSRVFLFEPRPGVKANMKAALGQLSKQRMEQEPKERTRLFFMLAWFHSIVQERLRYVPLGWSKTFEFGDTDFRGAANSLDYWVSLVSGGRDHVDPEEIPWKAFRTLMGQAVYGGRVDNPFDQRLLDCLLEQFFTPKCFDFEFPLIHRKDADDQSCSFLAVPEGSSKADFERWIDRLPDNESPKWLGLPEKAELLLLLRQGHRSFQKLLRLQDFELEEESDSKGKKKESKGEEVEGVPQWIVSLKSSLIQWSELLPEAGVMSDLIKTMKAATKKGEAPNPLKRCFEREISLCSKLVAKIHRDFDLMFQICKGELKLTNYLRSLMLDLSKGLIPKHWMSYVVPEGTSFGIWLVDLRLRVQQFRRVGLSKNLGQEPVWLGGLFNPEAFITATRQAAARAHSWSLENLELSISVMHDGDVTEQKEENTYSLSPSAEASAAPAENVIVVGVTLEGAQWDKEAQSLILSEKLSSPIPGLVLMWKNKEEEKEEGGVDTIPVYLNENRLEHVFSVQMGLPGGLPSAVFYQRGTAFTIWNPPL